MSNMRVIYEDAGNFTIAVNGGHGIATAGKRTPVFTDGYKSPITGKNFMHEWEFNRATAVYLIAELKRCGFKTIDISPTSEDIPLATRYKKADNAKADLYFSIHANAHTGVWGSANGVETIIRTVTPTNDPNKPYTTTEKARIAESLRIAKIVQADLVAATGLTDRCKGMVNKVLERNNLAEVKYPTTPSMIVECGFMDNLKEAKLLISEEYRKLCAITFAKSICKAFNVKYVEEVKTVSSKPTKFPDVSADRWSATSILKVDELGIMGGYPDGSFKPGNLVTREEMATIIVRTLKAAQRIADGEKLNL